MFVSNLEIPILSTQSKNYIFYICEYKCFNEDKLKQTRICIFGTVLSIVILKRLLNAHHGTRKPPWFVPTWSIKRLVTLSLFTWIGCLSICCDMSVMDIVLHNSIIGNICWLGFLWGLELGLFFLKLASNSLSNLPEGSSFTPFLVRRLPSF